MRFELQKLVGDRRILALVLALLLVNGVTFFRYAGGRFDSTTAEQIRQQYLSGEDLTVREEELREQMRDPAMIDDPQVYEEYMAVRAANQRIAEASGYEEFRQTQVNQAQLKLRLGIFGGEDSFSAKVLRRGMEDYQAMEGVVPTVDFFGGAERLTAWRLTEGILGVLALIPGLVLFSMERGSGVQALTHPTKHGRLRLFARKYGACALLTVTAALVLYLTNFFIVRFLFGQMDLGAPVQSIYGFAACTQRIRVGDMLVMLLGQKLLWALAWMSLGVLCASGTGSSAMAAGSAALVLVLAWIPMDSANLWLRWTSLVRLASGDELFRSSLYLNLFGHPMPLLPVTVVLLALLTVVCACAAGWIYCRRQLVSSRRSARSRYWLPHTSLMGHEMEKSLRLWRAPVLLVMLAVIQIASYSHVSTSHGIREYEYRQFSAVLSGLPTPEKERYLADQAEVYAKEEQVLERFRQRFGDDSEEYRAAVERSAQILSSKESFEEARNQYESLRPGQSYLYQTPYEKLLGPERRGQDAMNYAKAFVVLTLLLAGSFAMERETGVALLQTAAGRDRSIRRRKLVLMVGYSLVVALLAFLPRMVAVFHAYGGLEMTAWANAVNYWVRLPDGVSVAAALLGQLGAEIVVCTGAGGLICLLSSKLGSTGLTILAGMSSLLILDGGWYLLG